MSADRSHESRDGHVLVLDAGSSSLHIALFAADGERVADRDASEPPGPAAAAELRNFLSEVPAPAAVGHRIVHSGPRLTGHTLIDARVRALLADVADLAPLHVPPVCMWSMPHENSCPTFLISPASVLAQLSCSGHGE
ncbi:hypothetical protein [Streptomyces murinus]|uniref:hypothetical protein n=1 Tax=Streptomyces murinus TaxID=33900 RepID=UPI003B8A93B0